MNWKKVRMKNGIFLSQKEDQRKESGQNLMKWEGCGSHSYTKEVSLKITPKVPLNGIFNKH